MNGKEVWLSLLGLVAAIAAGLGIKWGQRKADKRVEKVADGAVEKMHDARREKTKERLEEIEEDRVDGNSGDVSDWIRNQPRK